jgi:hypothetical protein
MQPKSCHAQLCGEANDCCRAIKAYDLMENLGEIFFGGNFQ